MDKGVAGLIVGIIFGAIAGYIIAYAITAPQIAQLEKEKVAHLAEILKLHEENFKMIGENADLLSKWIKSDAEKRTLEKEITSLKEKADSYLDRIRDLTENEALKSSISTLEANITTLRMELKRLQASIGKTIITLSGNYGKKVSPIFHVPTGHYRIEVRLTPSDVERMWFSLGLWKVGKTSKEWSAYTWLAGTWTIDIYLTEGDYFFEVDAFNFRWKANIYALVS